MFDIEMGWRYLLFANWPIDPAAVDARIPDSMTVDTFDGEAWLSVVPFTNVDVRPAWVPSGLGLPLPELNLRTYVTVDGEPGVYFFSLDADGVLGVSGARLFHHLPYYYADIDIDVEDETGAETVRFDSRRRHPGARYARFRATYGSDGERFVADEGSLEAFLTERYRYYAEGRDGELRYANIRHDPWPLYPADVTIHENSLFSANGFDHPDTDPTFYYSPGVDTWASRSLEWDRL
jgi:uncharacterized protein YqjF (DUF2071 family)